MLGKMIIEEELDTLKTTLSNCVDKLDISVSSRAPASTALSNSIYTNARASNLDKLDTNVSTRARQDMLGLNTDVGALKGLAYNENLHQKCADIIALSNDILTNTNNIAIKSGGGGDFNRKELIVTNFSLNIGQTWEYLNSKGGIAIIWYRVGYNYSHNLVVDGVRIMEGKGISSYWQSSGNSFNILIPFKESIKIEIISGDYSDAIDFKAYIYLNKE